MKPVHSAIFIAAITLTLAAAATPSRAGLLITEVMSSSGGGGTNDWFELTNNGSATLDLTGYHMDDNSSQPTPVYASSVALQGVTSIPAGQSVVFLESTDTTTPGSEIPAFRTFWGLASTAPVGFYQGSGVSLGSTGDAVVIFDATQTVMAQVNFGAATTGSSFYGDSSKTATFTSISTAGQMGAYNSPGTITAGTSNVGTPDFVPEPSSEALIGLAAATGSVGMLRRRKSAARV